MKLRTAAGIALVAGVLGMAGTASADHGENDRTVSSIRIGGSGIRVSVNVGSAHSAHWLGTLTIDGCEFVIYECENVAYEIVKAFRREGYRASEWRGEITVDYWRKAPELRWHSHDYDLLVKDDCDELTICLVEQCDHVGTVIGNGGYGRNGWERVADRHDREGARRDRDDDRRRYEAQRRDDDRRREARERDQERQREARKRDDERRREARERDDRGRRTERAAPRISPQPYRPATNQPRPKIIGAWVPEAPKE